ncbi:unnamed protein product [Boreogadus saida]
MAIAGLVCVAYTNTSRPFRAADPAHVQEVLLSPPWSGLEEEGSQAASWPKEVFQVAAGLQTQPFTP